MNDDPKEALRSMGDTLPKNEIAEAKSAPAKHELMAGGAVRPIIPQSMEDAYRIAQAVVQARMAPRGIDTPQQALVAIMQGLEVGMTPMQSIQRIAVIGGRPTIWGDAAIGLVRASGKLETMREWLEGTGDEMTAVCETKRKGEGMKVTASFSVEDAKTAGLWGKSGPWQTHPKRMLQMRARGFALRDGFADILGGMYLREEVDDVDMVDVTPAEPSNVVPLKAEGIVPTSNPTAAYTDAVRDSITDAVDAATDRLNEDASPEAAAALDRADQVNAAVEAEVDAANERLAEKRETAKTTKRRQTAKKAPRKAATAKGTRTPRKAKKAASDAPAASETDHAALGKEARKNFWKAGDVAELVQMWDTLVVIHEPWPDDELAPVERTYKERLAKLEADA